MVTESHSSLSTREFTSTCVALGQVRCCSLDTGSQLSHFSSWVAFNWPSVMSGLIRPAFVWMPAAVVAAVKVAEVCSLQGLALAAIIGIGRPSNAM